MVFAVCSWSRPICVERPRAESPLHLSDWIEDKPLTGSEVFGPGRASLELAPEISAKNLMFSSSQFVKFGQGANANGQAQFAFLVEPFREMFNLLEEHTPTWYTEEHHRRAVAALGALFDSLRETDHTGDVGLRYNLSNQFAGVRAIPSLTQGQVMKRRGFLFSAIKRRFFSGLMAWPLVLKARFFPARRRGKNVLEGLPPDQRGRNRFVPCSLPRGHEGPHIFLNPPA